MTKADMTEDIGLRIGTKDEAHWNQVVKGLEVEQRNLDTQVIFNDLCLLKAREMLKLAEKEGRK